MTREEIRKLRNDLGLTQTAFAERLGLDQSSISRLETGDIVAAGPILILLRQMVAALPPKGKRSGQQSHQAA